MTIGGVPPDFINHGLAKSGVDIIWLYQSPDTKLMLGMGSSQWSERCWLSWWCELQVRRSTNKNVALDHFRSIKFPSLMKNLRKNRSFWTLNIWTTFFCWPIDGTITSMASPCSADDVNPVLRSGPGTLQKMVGSGYLKKKPSKLFLENPMAKVHHEGNDGRYHWQAWNSQIF